MSELPANETPTNAVAPAAVVPLSRGQGPGVKQIAVVVVILAVAITVTALTSDVTKALEPGIRLVDGHPYLPPTAGEWQGEESQGLSPEERQILPVDTDGVRRRYRTKEGQEVACSIVLAGRDVTSIHRPELCLPGQGWNIEREQTETIRMASAPGGVVQVTRMDATHAVTSPGGRPIVMRSVFFYWFIGKGRSTPYHWQRILWTAKDRVLHNRNHRWAYVLIHVPVGTDLTPETAARGQAGAVQVAGQFIQAVYPSLTSE